ncbi:MAG: type II toxin-antitoxin system VapC family toxin, partial [Pyrinomonadaceae bacterium]
PLLRLLWQASQAKQISIVTSELTLLETLVAPFKQNNQILIKSYESLLTKTEVQLLPITVDILRQAASLRAQYNFKTPDAIHAASALACSCIQIITNDTVFSRLPGLQVVILKDLL